MIKLATNVFALYIVSSIIPGVVIKDLWSAIVAAVVIGVINTFLKPILIILSLPVTILTFGVFAFFINVFLLYLASSIVEGFTITDFPSAIIASIALFFVSWFLHKLER